MLNNGIKSFIQRMLRSLYYCTFCFFWNEKTCFLTHREPIVLEEMRICQPNERNDVYTCQGRTYVHTRSLNVFWYLNIYFLRINVCNIWKNLKNKSLYKWSLIIIKSLLWRNLLKNGFWHVFGMFLQSWHMNVYLIFVLEILFLRSLTFALVT